MKTYYLGMDAGGTKTYCALFDENGTLIKFHRAGTANHELLPGGITQLRIVVEKIFAGLLENTDITPKQIYAGIGMAGIDSNVQYVKIAKIFDEIGLKKYFLCNDAFLGIRAQAPEGYGVCAISGTGSKSVVIDNHKNMKQIGGLYEFSGDYAGGKMLGAATISSVYDEVVRKGRKSRMSELVMDMLGVSDEESFLDCLTEGIIDRTLETKDFAEVLFKAAEEKDETALEILRKSGEFTGKEVEALLKKINFEPDVVPVILLGSLFTKGTHEGAVESLQRYLENAFPKKQFLISKLKCEPVTGAVLYASDLSENQKHFSKEDIDLQISQCMK